MHDVIVVGAGVIGLAIAREVAAHGRTVLLLDRGVPGEATSWAAAGMLAPLSEAALPDPFFDLCAASLRMYRAWTDQLREETGIDSEYMDSGLLYLAMSETALSALKHRLEWQRSAGLACELLGPEDVCRIEPMITLRAAGALLMRDEHQVTPRRLVEALRLACLAASVEIRSSVRVEEILHLGNRACAVKVGEERIPAGTVVISSGVWSSEIAGLRPPIPVYPRKGQILSLAAPGPTFRKIVRWENGYLVPRRDGQLILGATDENVGFDRNLTAAGVGKLLAEAQQLSSHLADYPITEMWTGLRPATPDSMPIIGRAGLGGLIYATGHYRNGILLAPITAALVAALVEGREPALSLEPYSPARFA